jgi:hypothetical protein
MTNYVTNGYGATPYGFTPPTPSGGYSYGHSEGSGIMVPHTPHHQRRSTFGGISKESNIFPSSITASPPRTPKKGSPATGGPNNKLDGWLGYHGNEKFAEVSDKKSCDLTFTNSFEDFDDEKR